MVNPRFYVYHRRVGVGSRFKHDLYGGFAGTGGVGYDVLHALNAVDGPFQGNEGGFDEYVCTGFGNG